LCTSSTSRLPRLRLIATAKPWRLQRAEEELGDSIYTLDSEVRLEVDKFYPLIYVVSVVDSMKLFRIVVKEPPAYVERLVPVESLVNNLDDAVIFVKKKLAGLEVGAVNVEVKPRGYFLSGSEKRIVKDFVDVLAEAGLVFRRKTQYAVKVEDTRYGIAVSVIRNGWDRISYWRRRRLGLIL